MNRLLLIIAVVSFAFSAQAQTAGQWMFQQRASSGNGFTATYLTGGNNKLPALNGSGAMVFIDQSTFQTLNANLTSLSSLADPNADRIVFWDDSAGAYQFLTISTGLSLSGTTITAEISKVSTPVDNQVAVWTGDGTIEGTTGLTYNGTTLAVTGGITATSFTGSVTGNVVGNVTGALTGNASTATTAGTVTTSAQPSITSVGTLTILNVDTLRMDGNTLSSTLAGSLRITPLAGQDILLDSTISIDAGVITGATSITSTGFTGALTGNASTATALATPRNINGTAFDGTANITVTAAGSTLSDTVTVEKGGTGAVTLGANGVVIGQGTGAVSVTGAGTAGQALISNGAGVDPSFQVTGKVAQVVLTSSTTEASTTAAIPMDGTIPQSGEGTAYASLDTIITPKSASSQIIVEVTLVMAASAIGTNQVALFKDSGANAIAGGLFTSGAADYAGVVTLRYSETSGSTTARTFKIRHGHSAGSTSYINRTSVADLWSTALFSTMKVTEVLP